jgi:hypothetical protein
LTESIVGKSIDGTAHECIRFTHFFRKIDFKVRNVALVNGNRAGIATFAVNFSGAAANTNLSLAIIVQQQKST